MEGTLTLCIQILPRLLTVFKTKDFKQDRSGWANWSESFLMERKMKVVVNGEESSEGDFLSEVLQGSVLGPLFFFILFINDMSDVVKNASPIST